MLLLMNRMAVKLNMTNRRRRKHKAYLLGSILYFDDVVCLPFVCLPFVCLLVDFSLQMTLLLLNVLF
jgi:hypothetical protein